MTHPYELDEEALAARIDEMVDVTFGDLTSQFLLLPRGNAFVTYADFRDGYEALRMATGGFVDLNPANCWNALRANAHRVHRGSSDSRVHSA